MTKEMSLKRVVPPNSTASPSLDTISEKLSLLDCKVSQIFRYNMVFCDMGQINSRFCIANSTFLSNFAINKM
jgi:hypothetical protein